VVDAASTQMSDADPRVAELVAENASLRGELTKAQSALANLRVRYHQLLEELHLLKRRLVIAKAERLDDVEAAQLAFDKLLAETEAMEKVLDAATDAETKDSVELEVAKSDDIDEASASPEKEKRRRRTGAPPTGRRDLEKTDLPVVRVEVPDPELEGKAARIGVEEHSRVGYERGGYRRVVVIRFVYKETSTADAAAAATSEPSVNASDEGSTTTSEPSVNADDPMAETTSAPFSYTHGRSATLADDATTKNQTTGVRIVTAPMPKEIMKRGMLAPSMIAHLLTMKYVLGVPFYRYEQRCAAEGFPLDRGTMCRYAEHVGATLGCIVEAARTEAITSAVCLSTDATGIAIQPTPLGDGKRQPCRKGHFFVTLADKDHVFLDFQPKHTSLTVWNMFKGFSGFIQADAHVIYDALFKGVPPEGAEDESGVRGPPPIEVGCFSHARRKYWEAAICRHPLGLEGVRLIDAIFAADKKLADLAPAQRKDRRDKTVCPLVDAFFNWARTEKAKLESRGLVATALGYSVRHEQALRRFLDDGRLRMDNNPAENALRTVAVGRKAFLFYGSDDHATAAGNILSLAASCKLHDLDPEAYFTEIIRVLPYWPRDRYLELAPKYWRATRARLDPKEIERELGTITIPPPAPKEQPSSN
jgi:Transposase IS66 family/IS66 C-terminal element